MFDRLVSAGPLTLYAVGPFNTVSKSVDGGLTWQMSSLSGVPLRELTGISCGDERHCLMTTRDGPMVPGPLYRTVDGGVTATAVTPSTDPALAVVFASPSRVIAAGGAGSAEVSSDAGSTWSSVGSRTAGVFGTLAATAANIAYSGGAQGALVRTNDGGQTWANVSPRPTRRSRPWPAGARLGSTSWRPMERSSVPTTAVRELQPARTRAHCT